MSQINQLGKTQFFEWGSILWFVEPSNLDTEHMSIGLTTFYPKTTQEEHLHFGYEQVIYVVSGTGIQVVDGQEWALKPGDLKHLSPYTRHKVINDSTEELRLIIVYTPTKFQQMLSQSVETLNIIDDNDIRSYLDLEVIGGLLRKLSEALGLSLTIIDNHGEFIIKTDNFSKFCCLLSEGSGGKHCQKNIKKAIQEIGDIGKPHLFLCCNEVASIIVPILNRNSVEGFIKCGEIYLTKQDCKEKEIFVKETAKAFAISYEELLNASNAIKVEPKNRLYTAAEATFAIANCITEMTSAALRQKELDNSHLSLMKEQMATAKLEKALQEADFKLLQSQINPHFLFNTLNTIAQLAYIEGSEKVAGLVWSLSDLLRYTLKKTEELIPLHEEIRMMQNYLHIQQSRYGDRLKFILQIEPEMEAVPVPCMLLQPIIENAIVHGFESITRQGLIKLAIFRKGERLCCHIEDNGSGCDPKSLVKTSGIGLNSVKNRLQYYFKGNFEFSVESQPGKGTTVFLSFPIGGNDDANR